MKSIFACESVVKQYLPAMRASIAKKLYAKGFTQKQIADELGLSQPVLSKYLSNSYGRDIHAMEKLPKLEKTCSKIAGEIEKNKWATERITSEICSACTQFDSANNTCLMAEVSKTLKG